MYHERQRLQFCALHVLNNLFQEETFCKQDLDDICYSLSPDATVNPHKSFLGFGNYDVNVLTMALQTKDYQFIWFDKRKDLNILDLAHIYGFIINKTHKLRCFGIEVPFKQRHWSAVRNMNGCFYDLDSKLDEPKCIGGSEKVLTFLRSEMACQKTELFLVVASLVAETKTWMKVDSDS